MKNIIWLAILLWPFWAHAQNVEISPIPLEPMVHENKHKQALKALDTAKRQLKETQKALEAEKKKHTDLQQKLTTAQKALEKAQKNLEQAEDNYKAKLSDAQKKASQKVKRLQTEIARLEKRLANHQPTSTSTAPSRIKAKYPRRPKPITVSGDDFKRVFKLDKNRRPEQYVPVTSNRFKKIKNDQAVIDNTTGLMWQQSGASDWMIYKDAQQYIKQLNKVRFAGYKDWRLPTVDELTSLITKTEQNGDLYIHPVFDKTQSWCWSSDQRAPVGVWNVPFHRGEVYWNTLGNYYYVRAVRARQ